MQFLASILRALFPDKKKVDKKNLLNVKYFFLLSNFSYEVLTFTHMKKQDKQVVLLNIMLNNVKICLFIMILSNPLFNLQS